MVNEQIKADGTLVSIDVWRDDPSKVRIFIKDRDTIIIPRNYLYEMRQCIDDVLTDTVLGEECAVCNPEWEGKQPIPLCEEHDEEILGQPLTEGEEKLFGVDYGVEGGDKTCKIFGTVKNGKVEVTNVEFSEPQESNKEEMGKGCYTDKLGQLVHDIPHTCQEPSKKPSERIEEFAKNSVGFAENIGGKVDGIIKILDELHESGKI